MHRIYRNLLIVLLACVAALAFLYPPQRTIRLGKDLRGGVSLTYSVQIRPGENAARIIEDTITVLKERVDPQGIMEVSMTRSGRDRIEITMPLPGPEVKALREKFEAELSRVALNELSPNRLDQTMRLEPDARAQAIDELSLGEARRKELLTDAAAKFDTARAARDAIDAARREAKTEAQLDALIAAAAEAELAYDAARQAVLMSTIAPGEVRRALLASNRPRSITDVDGTQVRLPSPRERSLERLRQAHPDAKETLDRIVAAYAVYEANRRSLDDPQDLIRLLRGAGVLSFRIAIDPGTGPNSHPDEEALRRELRERGPRNATRPDAHWYRINQIENWYDSVAQLRFLEEDPARYFADQGFVGEEFDAEYYLLLWDTRTLRLTPAEGRWRVDRAYEGVDQVGRPAIDFVMDERGALLLGDLTREPAKTNLKMAVLLDDQIYTAPSLRSQISKSGQITGNFSAAERQYVIRVLAAGSLQAKLSPEPLSVSVLGPDLGADNLRQGMIAGIISLGVCAVFLIGYYFQSGAIAVVGLAVNALLLVGAMAMNAAAFTLPGIAGVILTFAMAVDANVLVFERMREELALGNDLKTAQKLGYQRANSAIIDGNLTNLIVCIVLATVGTPEIKGFGITMSIGVLTTLFAQVFTTRSIYEALVYKAGWKKTSFLPLSVPAVQRAFQFNVDWMGLRKYFYVLFAGLIILSVSMALFRGHKMFDTEFLGGTAVTLDLKPGPDGRPMTLTRAQVQQRVQAASELDPRLAEMRSADIIVVNPRADGVTSSTFRIDTLVADEGGVVSDAVSEKFQDVIDSQPALAFNASDQPDLRRAPVYPILLPVLGQNIEKPELRTDTREYIGGVAVVLTDISPPQPIATLRQRLDRTRTGRDFADLLGRPHDLVLLSGAEDAATGVVLLVRDTATSFFDSEERWLERVAAREWALVRASLAEPTKFLNVESFTAQIADRFIAQATVAVILSVILVIIYVWVRFGSLRFALAAMVPTLHDCVAVVGLIALAEILYDVLPGPVSSSLGLLPFKIDLTTVAAILTVLGYSINDKIVVLDRIRENRGKVTFISREMINQSINQTMSRTVMTGTTTILATFVMYAVGGESIRAFAYALGLGVIIGTISSVCLGAPMVWSRKLEEPTSRL
jgi:SecD/SecF fusion protein